MGNKGAIIKKGHLPELQSLRGLAAVVVVLHHCSFYPMVTARSRFIFEALLNAHAAVIVFFVLSGYVLTRALSKNSVDLFNVVRFYIARIFRIYPALWFAALSVVLFAATGLRGVSDEYSSIWFMNLNKPEFSFLRLASLAAGRSGSLLPPSWSISVELFASLLMPLLVLIVKKGWKSWFIAQLFLLLLAVCFNDRPIVPYLWAFAIGSGIVLIEPMLKNLDKTPVYICSSVAFLGLCFFRLISTDWRFEYNYGALLPLIVETFFAGVLLSCIVVKPISFPFLNSKALTYVGDISYSLYLIHWPIMASIGFIFSAYIVIPGSNVAFGLLVLYMLITLAASMAVATFIYYYIELPGIALGKFLAKRWGFAPRESTIRAS